ncbi:hypothetical protein TrST_g4963 [Triparma strigata]|uniref:C2H2-type domain-containing protein n=1 Tax=Triparma strigata TaxID=1606541 RepID=A0A9W7ES04_9STRA|nr:hypothetical protein TrST_g4963 [Triparma strigata]
MAYDAPPFYTYLPDPLLCKELAPPGDDEQYKEYQLTFLSGYIRKFFNYHIDDPWFLSSYDPLTSSAFLKSHLDHLDSRTFPVQEERYSKFYVINDVSTKISPQCVTQTLKRMLKIRSPTATPIFEVRISLRSLIKSQYVVLFPKESEYELFTQCMVKEAEVTRREIKERGCVVKVESEDLACREYGCEENGGEGKKDTVKESWEFRVGGEENRHVSVVKGSEVYGECLEVLEEMFGKREGRVMEVYRWNIWEGRWAHPGEDLVREYKEDEEGRDKTKSLRKGLEKLKELRDLRKEGKILPDDVMELKVQMTEELKTAEEKWADQHTKVEGTGDTEKFRCRFHFCNKLFKTKDFLTKHLHKKHGKYKDYDLMKEKDEYMKMMFERKIPERLPPVCIKVPNDIVEVDVEGTFECPTVPDVWSEIQKERNAAMERMRTNELEAGREVSTFVDVDDMKDESKEVVVDEELLKRTLEKKEEGSGRKKKRRKLID